MAAPGRGPGIVRSLRLGLPLMPLGDLPFGLEPVGQIVSVFAIALLPKVMRSFGDLFLQIQVLVHAPLCRRRVF
jgi:hypothetical protein